MERFRKLSVLTQTCLIVLTAVIGAESLTLVFYSIFFADRLILDLILTGIIVVIVGFPLAYFFMDQQLKLSDMAARLSVAARTDALTGLINRRTFFDEATGLIAGSRPSSGAILFIDVDHFKSINDAFGHAMGDVVLQEIASVIRSTVRVDDLASRFGGEEFVVFLQHADPDTALRMADRIRMNVRDQMQGTRIPARAITVSIGLCLCEPGLHIEEILLRADRNLYAAKLRGRDTIVHDGPAPAFVTADDPLTTSHISHSGAA